MKYRKRYSEKDWEQNERLAKEEAELVGRRHPRKKTGLPAKYRAGFLAKMDHRHLLSRELHAAYDEITGDLGGVDTLSHVKRSLCERFVWLETFMRGIEVRVGQAGAEDADKLLGRWVQAVNTLTGLARTLGLERRSRHVDSLQTYVAKKNTAATRRAKERHGGDE